MSQQAENLLHEGIPRKSVRPEFSSTYPILVHAEDINLKFGIKDKKKSLEVSLKFNDKVEQESSEIIDLINLLSN